MEFNLHNCTVGLANVSEGSYSGGRGDQLMGYRPRTGSVIWLEWGKVARDGGEK